MPLNLKSPAFVGIVSEIPEFIEATGGVETFDGDFKIHTFNGDGLLQLTAGSDPTFGDNVEYLVIAGGGGGDDDLGVLGAGGAGAGGMLEGTNHTVSTQGYPITVGDGGTFGIEGTTPTDGGDSTFDIITSTGGGRGGCGRNAIRPGQGHDGGSGGGNGNSNIPGLGIVGQGNDGGGPSTPTAGTAAAGGGGKGGDGQPGYFWMVAPQGHSLYNGGDGGLSATNSITGSPVDYCGGGGGGASSFSLGGASGGAGAGTGGNNGVNGGDATPNTGSGAGGCGRNGNRGGIGGSGVVIIRYKFQ